MSDPRANALARHRAELVERIEALAWHIEDEGADEPCAASAHAIKGAALTLGIDGLAVAAAAIEAACDPEGGDVAAASRAVALARRELAYDRDLFGRLRHDLRGGLNIVVGHASLLELEPLTPVQADSVREILAAADAMAATLDRFDPGAGAGAVELGSGTAAAVPGGRKVLLVEDDPPTARVLERMLVESGATVVHARTGAEALRAAAGARPDLVLLDLRLPDAAGREVIRALRSIPGLETVPIAVSSGDSGTALARELVEAGATAILPKPVDFPALRRLLDPG